MERISRSIKAVGLVLIALGVAACAGTTPSEDASQCTVSIDRAESPPDMDTLCKLIRSHDEKEEGDPESLEYIKQYSKCDELAEKNRHRLRSLCYAWSYKGSAPPVVKIRRGEQMFEWTDACEVATGSLNQKLDMPDADGDAGYYDYRRYLSTALDVQRPADEQDLICYFATLDRDNDQVPDYMVSDHGRFTQNDVDVDNDGVRNARDANPVDSEVGEAHSCGAGGFPEHLELWSCTNGDDDEACQLQKDLYEHFDIVAVNREFGDGDPRILASLRVIYDVMNLVFRQGMLDLEHARDDCPGKPTLPSFKTVSFENCPHDTLRVGDGAQQCLPDASTTGAEAIAQNGTFVVVPDGAGYASLIRLGTYIHELGHLFSFALDYDAEKYASLVGRNYWESANFSKVLEPMGWSIAMKEEGKRPDNIYAWRNVLNVEDHVLFDEDSYQWNGYDVLQLVNMIECGVDNKKGCSADYKAQFGEENQGYLAVADDFRRQNLAVFTWYGAADPWEWFAEAVMAYFYRRVSDHIATRSDPLVVENTRVLMRARVLETYWGNEFYYENMSDSLVEKFEEIFPMDEAQLDELVCRYIVNSDDVLFGGEWERTPESYGEASSVGYFQLDQKLDSKETQARLTEEWQATCDSFSHLKQAISLGAPHGRSLSR